MFVPPLQGGVEIIGLVWAGSGVKEPGANHMAQNLLHMLTVLLVNSEQEKGEHQADHQHCRRVVPDTAPREKVGGNPHQTARAEANQLTGGQAEYDLVLDLCQILWDWDKWHTVKLFAGKCAAFPGVPPSV